MLEQKALSHLLSHCLSFSAQCGIRCLGGSLRYCARNDRHL